MTGHSGHGRVTRSTRDHERTAAPTPVRSACAASASQPDAARVGAFFDAVARCSGRWLLTAAQRKRLTPAIAAALSCGWTPRGLAEFARGEHRRERDLVCWARPGRWQTR